MYIYYSHIPDLFLLAFEGLPLEMHSQNKGWVCHLVSWVRSVGQCDFAEASLWPLPPFMLLNLSEALRQSLLTWPTSHILSAASLSR